jgi:hypothetical protein
MYFLPNVLQVYPEQAILAVFHQMFPARLGASISKAINQGHKEYGKIDGAPWLSIQTPVAAALLRAAPPNLQQKKKPFTTVKLADRKIVRLA